MALASARERALCALAESPPRELTGLFDGGRHAAHLSELLERAGLLGAAAARGAGKARLFAFFDVALDNHLGSLVVHCACTAAADHPPPASPGRLPYVFARAAPRRAGLPLPAPALPLRRPAARCCLLPRLGFRL